MKDSLFCITPLFACAATVSAVEMRTDVCRGSCGFGSYQEPSGHTDYWPLSTQLIVFWEDKLRTVQTNLVNLYSWLGVLRML